MSHPLLAPGMSVNIWDMDGPYPMKTGRQITFPLTVDPSRGFELRGPEDGGWAVREKGALEWVPCEGKVVTREIPDSVYEGIDARLRADIDEMRSSRPVVARGGPCCPVPNVTSPESGGSAKFTEAPCRECGRVFVTDSTGTREATPEEALSYAADAAAHVPADDPWLMNIQARYSTDTCQTENQESNR